MAIMTSQEMPLARSDPSLLKACIKRPEQGRNIMNDDYLWTDRASRTPRLLNSKSFFHELRFDKTAATPPPFKLSVVPIRNRFSFPVKIAWSCVSTSCGAFAL